MIRGPATACGWPLPPTTAALRRRGAPTTSAAAPVVAGKLQLVFKHDSWVEVYDRTGARLYFGMARAGREMDLGGELPLKVLLGYARDIRVEYNGQLLDYAPFVNRGIARFVIGADGISAEPDASAGASATQQ